jgi:putative aldouronate transport system permease protein
MILSPDQGPLAQLSGLFGAQAPNLLAEPAAFPSIYVWSGVWQEIGYGAVIYLAALSNVSPELYEAARVDGASIWAKIRCIDFPALRPTIVLLLILALGNSMSVGFEKVYLLQNPFNLNTSEVISTYVYKVGLLNADFSFAAAVGLFNSAVGLVLIVVVNHIANRLSGTGLF